MRRNYQTLHCKQSARYATRYTIKLKCCESRIKALTVVIFVTEKQLSYKLIKRSRKIDTRLCLSIALGATAVARGFVVPSENKNKARRKRDSVCCVHSGLYRDKHISGIPGLGRSYLAPENTTRNSLPNSPSSSLNSCLGRQFE
jgi:hypothetical protein